mgnify:CR=1 FL=1
MITDVVVLILCALADACAPFGFGYAESTLRSRASSVHFVSAGEFIPQFDDDMRPRQRRRVARRSEATEPRSGCKRPRNQTLIKTATGIWSVTYNGENRPILWTLVNSSTPNSSTPPLLHPPIIYSTSSIEGADPFILSGRQ